MKNFLLVLFMFITTLSFGQKQIAWFDAGIKAMYGGSGLYNQAAADHPDLDYNLAFGNAYSIGGKFGINRNYSGLAIELMYNSAKHEFQYLGDDRTLVPEMEWQSYDLYLLFRNAKNLGFFEIGPKFSFLQEFSMSDGNNELMVVGEDYLTKTGISGVLSFGVNVIGTDGAFSGQIGIRAEYGFVDMMSMTGSEANLPIPAYVDGFQNDGAKTLPVYVGLVFEMNWGLGFYGISQCGGRAKFLSL